MTDPARAVSAHYLVRRDGVLMQLIDERALAWCLVALKGKN